MQKETGVLLRVPADVHCELKQACQTHKRSMQKIVLGLIEEWITNGAYDPLDSVNRPDRTLEDPEARQAINEIFSEIQYLKVKLSEVKTSPLTNYQPRSLF
jgi:hypothetical protein